MWLSVNMEHPGRRLLGAVQGRFWLGPYNWDIESTGTLAFPFFHCQLDLVF